jgi:hypothetical protein
MDKVMDEVEEFISGYEGDTLEVMKYLHDLMMDQPGIYCKLSFKIPFYYRNSWICYIYPQKKGGIEFVFTRGDELSNEQGILDARGRKQVAGLMLKTLDDIPQESLFEVIQEAILLDESVSYKSPYFPNRKKS